MKPWAMPHNGFHICAQRRTEEQGPVADPPSACSLRRDFGLIWLSQLVSQVGDGISNLALLWFVYSITGSPVKTTIIGLLHTIPPIVLGPFIGVLCGPVAEKILPHRVERVPGGADRHHSLRRFNRHLHRQSPVCPGPPRRGGDGDVQSGADVVGASDCPARAIYGRECSHPEHDQPGHHFRSGIERSGDCPVRLAGSALSERRHVFRRQRSASGSCDWEQRSPVGETHSDRRFAPGKISWKGWPSSLSNNASSYC